jgi:hypothetical protein
MMVHTNAQAMNASIGKIFNSPIMIIYKKPRKPSRGKSGGGADLFRGPIPIESEGGLSP